jgi:hypothetical protein
MRPHNQIPNSVTITNDGPVYLDLDGLAGLEAGEQKTIDISKYAENGPEGYSWKSKLWMAISGAVLSGEATLDSSTPSVTIGAIDEIGYGEETVDPNRVREGLPAYIAGPVIVGAAVPAGSAYIDLFFNKGVYQADGDPVAAGDLSIAFEQALGTATDAAILSVKQNDDADEGDASALAGGETTIRVFLTITGTVGGGEKVTLSIAGNVLADAEDNLNNSISRTVDLVEA